MTWAFRWASNLPGCLIPAWRVGLVGIKDGGQETIPAPARPDGDIFPTVSIPIGIKFLPSSSPNRGISHGDLRIRAPLPSLVTQVKSSRWETSFCERDPPSQLYYKQLDYFESWSDLICTQCMLRLMFWFKIQSSLGLIIQIYPN
jgi:hypothetical protein